MEKHNHYIMDQVKPDWLRITKAEEITGIKRGSLYKLMNSGEIIFSELRERNAVRGIRLINYDSLMDYISSNIVEVKSVD